MMVESSLGGAKAWRIWALGVLFVVFLFAIQTGYAIISPDFQKTLSLSFIEIGLIAAIYTWVFAVCQFFSGALLDVLGARKVLSASVLLVTVGVFILAHAHTFSVLVMAQLFLALGSCTGFVGAGFIGEQWFGGAKFSFMFGLVQLVVALSSAFTQNLFSWALGVIDWRDLYDLIGIFGGLLFIAYLLFMHDHHLYHEKPKQGGAVGGFFKDIFKDLSAVIKISHVWLASVGGGMTFSVVLALGVVWAPKVMLAHGLTEHVANLATSMVWLGLAIGSPLMTFLSDYFKSRKKMIVLGNVVQLGCLGILLFLPIQNVFLLMLVLLVFGIFNAAHMLAFSTAEDVVEERYVGTSSALVNGIMFILGGVMMTLPAKLAGAAPVWSMPMLSTVFLPLLLALLIAVIAAMLMRETYGASEA